MLSRVLKEIKIQIDKTEKTILDGNCSDWTDYKVKTATRRTLAEMKHNFIELNQIEEGDTDDDDNRVE